MQIPLTYTSYLDRVDFPFAEAFNATIDDFNQWDVPTLKEWVRMYVNYNNAVADFNADVLNRNVESPDSSSGSESNEAEDNSENDSEVMLGGV